MDALPVLLVELLIECREACAERDLVLESLDVLALVATAKLHDELIAGGVEHRVDFQHIGTPGIRVQHESCIGRSRPSR